MSVFVWLCGVRIGKEWKKEGRKNHESSEPDRISSFCNHPPFYRGKMLPVLYWQ